MRWQYLPDSLSTPQLIRKLNERMQRSYSALEQHGLGVAVHGADAKYPRPTFPVVIWIGSVAPANRQKGDPFLDTSE